MTDKPKVDTLDQIQQFISDTRHEAIRKVVVVCDENHRHNALKACLCDKEGEGCTNAVTICRLCEVAQILIDRIKHAGR